MELDACISSAALAIGAAMDLLAAARAGHQVDAHALHALLQGPHGQLQQAHQAARVAGRLRSAAGLPGRLRR